MNEMSLTVQIRCLEQMSDYLRTFCTQMSSSMSEYERGILSLKANGFSVESADNYLEGYYRPANDKVNEVISNIQSGHIAYIERVKEKLEEALRKSQQR